MPYQNYPSRLFKDLRRMLRASVESYGDRTLFLQKKGESYRRITYNSFYDDVCALGTELLARGLGGKRIMLIGENCYQWAVSYMAVICGVGVIVPFDKEQDGDEIAQVARLCDASVVICSSSVAKKLSGFEESLTVIGFGELASLAARGRERMKAGDNRYSEAPIKPSAMAALLFTSGTTGGKKGVMLSHRNICFNLYQMCKMIYIGTDDVFLSVLPMHHCYETTCGFLCPLSRGATVAFASNLLRLADDMKTIRPTVMLCVPLLPETLHRRIQEIVLRFGMEEDVRSAVRMTGALRPEKVRLAMKRKVFSAIHQSFGGRLRLLISGGASLDPKIASDLYDLGFKVLQGYGLTECAPIAALNRDTFYRHDSVGMACPDTLLDVYDVQNDGIGEIRFRGENVMLGYYGMPDETARVIRDGWFYTGDLGYMDEKGFLYILGRKKNLIIDAEGNAISPEELETQLNRNRFVKESVVTGIKNAASQSVEITAILYPDHDALSEKYGKDFTPSQLDLEMHRAVTGVNATVPFYKRIESFRISPSPFPKNTSHKIIRDLVEM